MAPYKAERNEEIYNRRKAGETFSSIAKSLSMSTKRTAQVFYKEERRRDCGGSYKLWWEARQ